MPDDYRPRPFAPISPWERRIAVALLPLLILGFIGVRALGWQWATLPTFAAAGVSVLARLVKSARVAGAWRDVVVSIGHFALLAVGLLAFNLHSAGTLWLLLLFCAIGVATSVFQLVTHRADERRYRAAYAAALEARMRAAGIDPGGQQQ